MSSREVSLTELAPHLVASAVMAPSSHNTQPWRFRVDDAFLDLRADRRRALPVNDPEDRELVVSCGCALLNLRAAAADAGLRPVIAIFPDEADSDLLARVELRETDSELRDAELFGHITRRRTCRRRFSDEPVSREAVRDLSLAAAQEGAWLQELATGPQRETAAALVAEGDSLQWVNPAWRRELATWMRRRHSGHGLPLPAPVVPIARLVIRFLNMGDGIGAKNRRLAEEAPVLAVLGTDGDTPFEWLKCGQALQRLLLTAVRHGLQASYLNQPIQVASLRTRLQNLLGRPGFPQLLLRLGKPESELPPSPRRPVEDVLERLPSNRSGGGP